MEVWCKLIDNLFSLSKNLSGGPQASTGSHGDEGDESWDDDDDASSYRDDDSSSDGDEDADEAGTTSRGGESHSVSCAAGGPSQPTPSTSNVAGTSAGTKHAKELEWDHSSMWIPKL